MTVSADELAALLRTLTDRGLLSQFDIRADGSVRLATGRRSDTTGQPAGTVHEFTSHADALAWAVGRPADTLTMVAAARAATPAPGRTGARSQPPGGACAAPATPTPTR